jgi:hypothetical protein
MKNRPYILTDFEDLALAACDDMYLETSIARNILSTWYERVVPYRELRAAYSRLIDLGLLRAYAKRNHRVVLVQLSGHRTQDLAVRATSKGRRYLIWKRQVA